jgi:hypothetical protein
MAVRREIGDGASTRAHAESVDTIEAAVHADFLGEAFLRCARAFEGDRAQYVRDVTAQLTSDAIFTLATLAINQRSQPPRPINGDCAAVIFRNVPDARLRYFKTATLIAARCRVAAGTRQRKISQG